MNPFSTDLIPADKAVARYMVSNGKQFVSFPSSCQGLIDACRFRSHTPVLKGRRVRHVIQCYPKQVPVGVLLDHSP